MLIVGYHYSFLKLKYSYIYFPSFLHHPPWFPLDLFPFKFIDFLFVIITYICINA